MNDFNYFDYLERGLELIKKEFGDAHKIEVQKGVFRETDYPKTEKHHRLIYQTYNLPLEELYYSLIKILNMDFSFDKMIKIIDSFASSESSSFFGANAQRLSAQQEKMSQYMATVGKMVKDLFQIVRELRILDERLSLYEKSNKGDESAEVTLKGTWTDLVEGGAKNPASVFGMANELGFAILPDLFFSINLKNADQVDEQIKKMEENEEYNPQLLRTLARKLKSYYTWKEHTYKELTVRRKFMIRYLKQHYDSIMTYLSWIKPYYDAIQKLQMNNKLRSNVEVVTAFESSMIEVEFLATKSDANKYKPVLIVSFLYRTMPQLSFMDEGQRGPIHVGRVELNLRGYTWTDEEIDKFLRVKREENFQMINSFDNSIKESLDALGDDLQKYLDEVQKEKDEKKEDKKKEDKKENKKNPVLEVLEPFGNVFLGFKELFSALIPVKKDNEKSIKDLFSNKKEEDKKKDEDKKKSVSKSVDVALSKTYDIFKKSHGMLS